MPGAGAKFLAASSALMRHSIACPCQRTSSWPKASSSPAAIRICSRTMSTPVVSSVTQCSTCTRVFISRKKYSPSWSRPSIVPAEWYLDGAGRLDGDLADLRAQLVVDQRGRRLLDQLLVAALDRAVALAEVDDVAVLVGQHLDLDVARVGQVALEVDGGVAEELLALAGGALEGLLELVGLERDAEALAAAAARGLDRDRVADLLGDLRGGLDVLDRLGGARHDRDARGLHQLARLRLRAHRLDRAAGGPMNVMPASSSRLAKAAFSARKP